MIHEVVQVLEIMSINYSNKAILSREQSLPSSACDPAIAIMQQTCTLPQSGTIRNSIDRFVTPLLHAPNSNDLLNVSLLHKITNKSLATRKFLPPEETALEAAVVVEAALAPRATIRTPTDSITKYAGYS